MTNVSFNAPISTQNGWWSLLPWAKISAPMIPVIAGVWYIGNWLKNLRQFNLQYDRLDVFPTDMAFWVFFLSTLTMISVYLGLSLWHFKKEYNASTLYLYRNSI